MTGRMSASSVPMLTRRLVLWGGAGARFEVSERTMTRTEDLWSLFRAKFVTDEGRVIDTANGNVSHSEGQGWGLLFAVSFNDKKTFESIFRWTAATLRRPHDRLHAWRFTPAAFPPVADLNNATDGDIFIAAALARAAAQWGHDEYAATADAISRDILASLVRRVGSRLVLLPAISGFERPDGTVINLSYYAFPFLSDLARTTASPKWAPLLNDGLSLITEGRFGKWMLPPDWLLLDRANHLQPAPGWPPRFSFDAIRIPLWLVWSRRLPSTLYQPFHAFWTSRSGPDVPAWADLTNNETSSYPAPLGMQAVMRLTEAAATHTVPDLPPIGAATTYYDAALLLLSHLAFREARDG
jgi:endoglucanase